MTRKRSCGVRRKADGKVFITTECATLLGYNSIEVERFDSEETTGMGENFASDFS